jgi:hypothetical protein
MGTNAFSPQRAESLRHFLLLPSPSVVYHGRKPTNLRVSLVARAAQVQASRLRVRRHAGAYSPAAQRATTGHPGRCVQRANANLGYQHACFVANGGVTRPPGEDRKPSRNVSPYRPHYSLGSGQTSGGLAQGARGSRRLLALIGNHRTRGWSPSAEYLRVCPM